MAPLLNSLKNEAELACSDKKQAVAHQELHTKTMRKQHFDVTASVGPETRGSLHVYTHLVEQLQDIFISIGYTIADGPELETDYYNFESLNIPSNHPARDIMDTFWVDIPGLLLRTHTSSVQIRVMEKQQPPIAIFAPGRVYRNEATDASHDFMFMQGEGLIVDKNISMSHLLATAKTFFTKRFWKEKILQFEFALATFHLLSLE